MKSISRWCLRQKKGLESTLINIFRCLGPYQDHSYENSVKAKLKLFMEIVKSVNKIKFTQIWNCKFSNFSRLSSHSILSCQRIWKDPKKISWKAKKFFCLNYHVSYHSTAKKDQGLAQTEKTAAVMRDIANNINKNIQVICDSGRVTLMVRC